MKSFLLASAVILSAAAMAAAQCSVASSPGTTNSGFPGITFNVANGGPNPIALTNIDVNIDAGVPDVQVWFTPMPADTVLTTQASWTLVDNFTGLTSNGLNAFTPLPAFSTPISIPAGQTYGLYLLSTATGSPINYTIGTAANATSVSDGTVTVFEGWGRNTGPFSASPISGRIPSVRINYVVPGLSGFDFQVNTQRSALRINNVEGNSCLPTLVNETIFTCVTTVPTTGTIAFSSVNVGLPYDIVLSSAALVPASSPFATTLPGGQIVNLNLASALFFLNGLFGQNVPGLGIPGAGASTLSFQYTHTTTTDFSIQAAVFDPTLPGGIATTLATEYSAAVSGPNTTVAGPTTDNAAVQISLTNPSTCFVPGITFHGTVYTQFWVSSNGRVLFVGTDTDAGASVAEVTTDNPFVGYWSDLNPALGGSITITNPASGIVRVDYLNVPYAGDAAALNTFGIEFDVNTGTVLIDGLTGIAANPQTTLSATNDDALLGTTNGNRGSSAAGGPTTFALGGSGTAINLNNAWYEHYDAVAGGAGLVGSLVPGTLNAILFVPTAAFPNNYDWVGL